MRILNIHDQASVTGGAEQIILRICNELTNRGHEIAVAYAAGSSEEIQTLANFPCYVLDGNADGDLGCEKAYTWIHHVIQESKPEILLVHNIFDFKFLSWLKGWRPVVRYVHDERVFCLDRSKLLPLPREPICTIQLSKACLLCIIGHAYWKRHLGRRPANIWKYVKLLQERQRILHWLKNVDHIVTDGGYLRDALVQNGLPEGRITSLSFPLEMELGDALGRPDGAPGDFVLFAGRLEREKGCHLVIEALPLIDCDVNLVICGAGPELNKLQSLSKKLGVENRVYFVDWLPNGELKKFFAHAIAVAVPSLWPEPLGMVGIEAMSFGKPVIAFDVGGIGEWLRHGLNGLMVPRGDIRGLAEALKKLTQNAQLTAKMGAAGRRLYEEKFRFDLSISKLLRVLERVLGNGS